MKINQSNLIAYANAFVSFVLPKIEVDEIILFGSVARGEADKKSDIDLFFNTGKKESKSILNMELQKFYKSSIYETFALKGITNLIKVEMGKLENWKLKRSIIGEGIVLFGRYRDIPDNLNAYTLFILSPIRDITKRNRVIRLLFGRTEKSYNVKGKVEEIGGKKISPVSFIIPQSKSHDLIKALRSEKVNFSFFDFWTDEI